MNQLIYMLGKRSRKVRRWYHDSHDYRYLWGIVRWIIDTYQPNHTKQFKIKPIEPELIGSKTLFAGAKFIEDFESLTSDKNKTKP